MKEIAFVASVIFAAFILYGLIVFQIVFGTVLEAF